MARISRIARILFRGCLGGQAFLIVVIGDDEFFFFFGTDFTDYAVPLTGSSGFIIFLSTSFKASSASIPSVLSPLSRTATDIVPTLALWNEWFHDFWGNRTFGNNSFRIHSRGPSR